MYGHAPSECDLTPAARAASPPPLRGEGYKLQGVTSRSDEAVEKGQNSRTFDTQLAEFIYVRTRGFDLCNSLRWERGGRRLGVRV